ncbi:hypothetical protein [Amycolatopsis sp. Hca4]|uniref:hypothetical protein n=1 Tax=Amycolatopsis sp. Hca4 TaxID=2742131 RepID=UPI0020CB12F3|nr:hypothetical protein [Amycolatopsis sp. Hca4]
MRGGSPFLPRPALAPRRRRTGGTGRTEFAETRETFGLVFVGAGTTSIQPHEQRTAAGAEVLRDRLRHALARCDGFVRVSGPAAARAGVLNRCFAVEAPTR